MRWILRNADAGQVERLAREAQLSPTIARLLIARGIESPAEAQRFLAPSLSDLHSPYLMKGLREAVERLQAAIAHGETVLIYGDYDVDGTTAVVILKTVLELCGGLPNITSLIASAKATACATRSSSRPPRVAFTSSSASTPAFAPSLPPKPPTVAAST